MPLGIGAPLRIVDCGLRIEESRGGVMGATATRLAALAYERGYRVAVLW